MTFESDNIRVLDQAYKDWHDSKGLGVNHLAEVFDDGVQVMSLAGGAEGVEFTRQRAGKADFLSYLVGLTADWEMSFYRIDEYIAQNDRVVAVGSTSWRNKSTGKIVVTPKIDIWRMKDGKAVQFSEFYDTAKLIAAAQP